MKYKRGQWGKDGQISQVNKPSQIDLITICQIHDCHNPAYKIFAMGKEFYYGYCKDHQELDGKMFYSFANTFIPEILPPLRTAQKCVCFGCSDIFCGNYYSTGICVYAPCKKHEQFYVSGWKKLTPEEAKDWQPPENMKPDTNSLNIDQILVNPEIKYYADWGSVPKLTEMPKLKPPLKIKKATLEPTEPESEPLIEGEVFLYHLIYRVGPTTYHFSVIAKNEADAKEKIISAKKYDYDQYFSDEIRKLRAHKNLGDVLSIYEKVG